MHPRRLFPAAALGAAALVLGACAPASDSDAPAAGGEGTAGAGECEDGDATTLSVWSWRPEDAETYEQIFDVFEDENQCIAVDFQTFRNTEYNQILQTGLTGSDGPDIAQVRSYGQLQPLIQGGNLVALDDVVPALAEFEEPLVAGAKGREDGQIYGVPLATQTIQMYYNTAIFSEHGLEEPETWEDFVAVNQTLADAGVTPMAVGARDAWIIPIVHEALASAQYGGAEFQAAVQAGEKDFTDPAYVASIQTMKDMQDFMPADVVGVSYTDSQVLFTSEQAAMFPGGSFELAFFQSENPDLELGVFQVPPPEGSVLDHPVSAAYADANWGLNAASEEQQAATELLNWMATEEFGSMVANDLKQFSPLPGVTFEDPLMEEMWSQYQESPSPYLLLVDFRYGEPLGTDLMGDGGQQLFLGELDAAGVAQKIQDGVSEWFAPGQ